MGKEGGIVHQSERDPHKSIFCGGLPLEVDDNALASAFAVHGEVEAARVVRDKSTGWSKGYGFIVFADKTVAERLRSAGKACVGGRAVDIGPALRGIGKGSKTENKSTQSDSGGRKVFVGGLPRNADEATMRWFFSTFGWCEDFKIVYDSGSGASKGYGFATFAEKEAAEHLKSLQHVNFNGVTLNVNEASAVRFHRGSSDVHAELLILWKRQWFVCLRAASMWAAQQPSSHIEQSSLFSPAGVTSSWSASDDPNHTIFCGGFATNVTENDLVLLFSQFGPVARARIITDSKTNQSKGYGFVTFATGDGCRNALDQRKVVLGGRLLDIGPAKKRASRSPSFHNVSSFGENSFMPAGDMAKVFPSTALHV